MDTSLIIKLAKGEEIDDIDIAGELYEICDRVHSGCNSDCPVYKLNGNKIPNEEDSGYGCDCFKSGHSMLKFIRNKH